MQSSLIQGIAGFTAYLRDNGYGVGISEQQAMLNSVMQLPVEQYRQIQPCWRAIVCSNKDHWRRYPELFNLYWLPEKVRGTSRMSGTTRRSRKLSEIVEAMHAQMDAANAKPTESPLLGFADDSAAGSDEGGHSDQAAGGASAVDPLTKRDFGEWLQSDLQQLNLLAEEVAMKVRKRLLRRKQITSKAHTLNLRGTLRKSVHFGGIPIAPVWHRPRRDLPNIFILVDVSRSMEMYAQLFLRVSRAFCEVTKARAFVFHTRLAEITDMLKKRTGRIQEKINAVTFGFGGGTRIATSLHDFVTVHAKSALASKSIVLVLSDGYDTDPAGDLAQALQLIAAKGAKIFWLHPSERTHFSASLELASPYVKRFIPAHNLESLQKLPDLVY
ncbi:VWA domain containing CoxE-like protein [mine drainage metagenome]|uniref:VWA domain containing CoxE-like protein n=1 Tax=mine drainage metagenome TaxID=410659 RepID=A0A1J5S9V5_9ZZZZ